MANKNSKETSDIKAAPETSHAERKAAKKKTKRLVMQDPAAASKVLESLEEEDYEMLANYVTAFEFQRSVLTDKEVLKKIEELLTADEKTPGHVKEKIRQELIATLRNAKHRSHDRRNI